jgi:chemotaxis protein CheD
VSERNFSALAAREVFLNPGELACGFQREVFGTLLGSCVAITLWNPRYRFGSICHFVLPTAAQASTADGRYGSSAFTLMRADLARYGIPLHECTAKIFGGGRMFNSASDVQDIGARNVAMARQLLASAGLAVSAENVGDEGYRRLYFDVGSGDVWLKFDWIDGDQDDTIL